MRFGRPTYNEGPYQSDKAGWDCDQTEPAHSRHIAKHATNIPSKQNTRMRAALVELATAEERDRAGDGHRDHLKEHPKEDRPVSGGNLAASFRTGRHVHTSSLRFYADARLYD